MRTLALVALAAYATAAAPAECGSLAAIRWLLGEWHADSDKAAWRESWREIDAATWAGLGVETPKAHPGKASAEELRLVEMGDGVFYVAKVGHNDLPIAFRLVECGADRLVFANPAHDFPRRLEYQRQPAGRLRVHVSDGADRGFTLDFARAGAPPPTDAAAVLAAEDARFAAMISADAAGMQRWLAEDLRYVHSTGAVESRDELIAGIRDGRMRYFAVTPADRSVYFVGPGASVVEGKARIRASAGSAMSDFEARYLAVYALDNGTWRLRAWQSLRLP